MSEITNQDSEHRTPASDLRSPSSDRSSPSGSAPRLEKTVRITEQVWPEGTVPVVSILCVTYNHIDFIRDAVEGFLMQETTFPVEIVIHDDASTDGTAEIVQAYQEKFPQLFRTILQKKNLYSSGNLPNGGEMAQRYCNGEFIALCDGDDYWISEEKLQKQVEILKAKPSASLIFHNTWVKHAESKSDYFLNQSIDKTEFTFEDVISRKWFIATPSMCFRRNYIKIKPNLSFCRSGDILIHAALSLRGTALYLDEVMAVYTRHDGGISTQWDKSQDHFLEYTRTNHFWGYWVFSQNEFQGVLPNVMEKCLAGILGDLVFHYVRKEKSFPRIDQMAVRKNVLDCLEKAKPEVVGERVLDNPIVQRNISSLIEGYSTFHIQSLINQEIPKKRWLGILQMVVAAVARRAISPKRGCVLMAKAILFHAKCVLK